MKKLLLITGESVRRNFFERDWGANNQRACPNEFATFLK